MFRAAALAIVMGLALAAGCQASVAQSPCKDVPAGGCPLSHGQACDDPACEAAYACNPDGTWTLDHACARTDAGLDASIDAEGDARDASMAPTDATIDAPPGASGGPGCAPLQAPDCPLATGLACPQGCCDCEDLFVCANGGWTSWGTCSLDAGIKPN